VKAPAAKAPAVKAPAVAVAKVVEPPPPPPLPKLKIGFKKKESKPDSPKEKKIPKLVLKLGPKPEEMAPSALRAPLVSPPPKSTSLHSKSPSIDEALGFEAGSPPPRTPSMKSSPDRSDEEPDDEPEKSLVVEFVPPTAEDVFEGGIGTADEISIAEKSGDENDDAYFCPVCAMKYDDNDPSGGDWIGCDADECNKWFHQTCAGLTRAPPKNQPWYCPECRVKGLGRKVAPKRRRISGSGSSAGPKKKRAKK